MSLELNLFCDESGSDVLDCRLAQAADYICTMEFTTLKYATHKTTPTDEKFFGSWAMFKKGILKEVRTKMI